MHAKSAVFSIDEHKERFARARAALKSAKLDACLMVAPENVYYVGGYETWVGVNSPQFLIFTAKEDAPTLVLRNVDLALARETTWVGDIRTYHLHTDSVADLVKKVLREKGLISGKLGMEFQSYALPHAMAISLKDALPGFDFADATDLFGDLRLVKSPAELEMLRAASKFAEIGLVAAKRTLKAGISEIELAAEIEGAMRRAGSDYWAIPTELSSGWRSAGGHAAPRPKKIEPGDLVHLEFAGVCNRYHATAFQTFGVGAPSTRAVELYELALQSLKAGLAATKPGARVDHIEEASLEPLRKAGLEHAAMMRFGYGLGIAYPPIWLETLQISRGFDRVLEPGMVFVLHACLELPDEELGVIQGGTYLLKSDGLEMLAGAGDIDLIRV